MTKVVILFCAVLGLTLGLPEKPAPYPAKGWKPQGARLELPRQYGTPREQASEIEFTTASNDYLPPTTVAFQSDSDDDDALRVQGLPATGAASDFRKFQQKNKKVNVQVQSARIQMPPAPAFTRQPILLSPVFAPQFATVNARLKERKFGQQVQEFANPKTDVQQLPARAYGPPQTNSNMPQLPDEKRNEPDFPQQEQPQPDFDENESQEDDDDDDAASDEPVIAVSNANASGDAVQDSAQGQIGQYYILLPDNSLQKVRFATKQTSEDRQINGFSAQLR